MHGFMTSALVALLAFSSVTPALANTGAIKPTKTCRRKGPWRSNQPAGAPPPPNGGGGPKADGTTTPSSTLVPTGQKAPPPPKDKPEQPQPPAPAAPKTKTPAGDQGSSPSPPAHKTAEKPKPTKEEEAPQPKTTTTSTKSKATDAPPAATPKPAPAPAPAAGGGSSGKAGIAWAIQEQDATPVKQFFTAGSKVSWWYNWNKNAGTQIFPKGAGDNIPNAEFIPMLFDHTFLDNGMPLAKGWSDVMVFNEPDLTGGHVSTAMSPAQAATEWKKAVDTLRKENPNAKFISPGLAFDINWLQNFFQAICPGGSANNKWGDCKYKPDMVNVHAYAGTVADLKTTVTKYHTQFGLPIILSEFACHVFPSGDYAGMTATPAQADKFMTEAVAWLDSTDWIAKYAWFGASTKTEYLHGVGEANRLVDASGQLTALGKKYMNGGK